MSTLIRKTQPHPFASEHLRGQERPARITASRGNTFAVYLTHLLRRSSRSTLIWALAVAAYGAVIVAAFPSLGSAVDVSSYPTGIREALNITAMDQIEPFLETELFGYLPLVLAFLPMTVFAAALAGAEERGSLDVLLGTPLPRRHLVLSTFLATAINLLVISIVLGAVLWLTSLAVGAELAFSAAMAGAIAAWPITLALGSVALLLSAVLRQRSQALGIAAGVMFVMYVLDLLSRLVDGLAWARYLSAFHYYGSAIQDGLSWGGAILLLAVAVVLAAAATALFERRDIYA